MTKKNITILASTHQRHEKQRSLLGKNIKYEKGILFKLNFPDS